LSGGFLLATPQEALAEAPWLDAVLLDFSSTEIPRYVAGSLGPFSTISLRHSPRSTNLAEKNEARDTLRYPVPRHDLFPIRRYRLPHSVASPITKVLASFGCPFRCSFCVCSNLPYRHRPPSDVIDELDYVCRCGIKEVLFADPTFGANRTYRDELCQRIIASEVKLPWICLSRVDIVDVHGLTLMKAAGCHGIHFGVETGSQQLRLRHGKRITNEQVADSLAACKRLGIATLAHIIIGLPGETPDTLQETIEFLRRLDADYVTVNMAVPVAGTQLHQEALASGLIADEPFEADGTVASQALTRQISSDQLQRWQWRITRSFYLRPRQMWRIVRGIRSFHHAMELLRNAASFLSPLSRRKRKERLS